jgi:apolipoprotein N-acyltransferase
MVRPVGDEQRYFNSALLTDARGRVVGRYDKHFLLPFGEFLPFGDWFPILYRWSPNSSRFEQGTRLEPLRIGSHEIATFICYEDVIPGFVRSIVRSGTPDLLANLTNDAWFGDTSEPWIHLALAKSRAIEQRRYLVRSTNSGVSAIIDPLGRVVVQTRPFEAVALRGEIAWLRPKTPYNVWGDAPLWVLAAFGLVLAFRPLRSAPIPLPASDA